MGTTGEERSAANLATVGEIYAAFGRGDMAAILATIDEGCEWERWEDHTAQRAGVPYLQPQSGPDGVAAFFANVSRFQINDFQVLGIWGSGDKVAVEVLIDAVAPGGGHIRDEELHVYTLGENGKVAKMRHYVDTAKHIAADRGEDATARGLAG